MVNSFWGSLIAICLVVRDRPLYFKLQIARALKICGSNSPLFVGGWVKHDRTAIDDSFEIAVAIITLESHRCRDVITGSVENERHRIKREGCHPFVSEARMKLQDFFKPDDGSVEIANAQMEMI